MLSKQPMYFDHETIFILRATLDDTWNGLRPEQRAMTSRTRLAQGILKSAAEGERDPARLRDAALMSIAA